MFRGERPALRNIYTVYIAGKQFLFINVSQIITVELRGGGWKVERQRFFSKRRCALPMFKGPVRRIWGEIGGAKIDFNRHDWVSSSELSPETKNHCVFVTLE